MIPAGNSFSSNRLKQLLPDFEPGTGPSFTSIDFFYSRHNKIYVRIADPFVEIHWTIGGDGHEIRDDGSQTHDDG